MRHMTKVSPSEALVLRELYSFQGCKHGAPECDHDTFVRMKLFQYYLENHRRSEAKYRDTTSKKEWGHVEYI